ncbi:hypothetical protein CFP56_040349 [Quercus suber]|uniref:Uncharacterized protein n=1 Tax=Quercus suber TaxID=58331 RepID=A0AAW0LM28_QUESU
MREAENIIWGSEVLLGPQMGSSAVGESSRLGLIQSNLTINWAKCGRNVHQYSEEPPQEYIVKDCRFGSLESSDPSPGSIPVIDISMHLLPTRS